MKPYLLIIGLFLISWAPAHEVRPAFLQLTEEAPGVFDVLWKVPAIGGIPLAGEELDHPQPGAPAQTEASTFMACGCPAPTAAQLSRGVLAVHPALPRDAAMIMPPRYERITGAEIKRWKIATGPQVLIVKGFGLLVKTITAFTLAHSITLALATLGVVNIPSAPVEAVIALSIVFVAAEIVRSRRGQRGLTERAPWLVAALFGLLHGFGFAGALSEVGLPPDDIPLALLFFNLGVEAGQLAFVAGVLAITAVLKRLRFPGTHWAPLIPPYAIGGVAMFWVLERLNLF